MIQAMTFDVFGTLLKFNKNEVWVHHYVYMVESIETGKEPYRPLSEIFESIKADWKSMNSRDGVGESLLKLKEKYITAPLSNADTRLITQLSDYFGLVWSKTIGTEGSGAFKPNPSVYEFGAKELGLSPDQILHVAAHPYDLDAAKAFGYKTAYIHWDSYADPVEEGRFDFQLPGISQLVDLAFDNKLD